MGASSVGANGRSLFWHSFAFSADRPGGGRVSRQSGRFWRSSARSLAERPTQFLFERLVGKRSNSSASASRYSCRLNIVGESLSQNFIIALFLFCPLQLSAAVVRCFRGRPVLPITPRRTKSR